MLSYIFLLFAIVGHGSNSSICALVSAISFNNVTLVTRYATPCSNISSKRGSTIRKISCGNAVDRENLTFAPGPETGWS